MFWGGDADDDFEAARERMVEALVEAGRIERDSTIAALKAVPRHEFVPEARTNSAYADRPLPIGSNQTISAPHMVGAMCDLLDLDAGETVLEIGTGCGYHAAVTAEIVGDDNVYSVEYVPELAEDTRERLADLGYDIHVRVGDGHEGWPEHAPYDAAYLTCAAPELPEAVVDQLRVGGRIVAPLGTARQTLVKAVKTEDGLDRESHGAVRFVPMQGGDS
ncbi:MAG: protein-L-isoaspartate(D-aspartate) O-methyltransferase [Natronomonas sp.]|jgi:protein-L-isoaspartate(D-aspartate) O-methyltransferase|uniref:protein-L-isoaspartate(D-aspartate) O-methyltransferase n=1 Tax=Natronomonas sp. TaxID=2184060 RepID=UPI0039890267